MCLQWIWLVRSVCSFSVKNALMNVILLIQVHTIKCTENNRQPSDVYKCNDYPNGPPYFIHIVRLQ